MRSPFLASLRDRGELPAALRDRIRCARGDLRHRAKAETVDVIGMQAARSRLSFLLAAAGERHIDIVTLGLTADHRVVAEVR